jgi:hypothetical protein
VRFYSAQYFLLSYHNFGADEGQCISSGAKNRERAVAARLGSRSFIRFREGRAGGRLSYGNEARSGAHVQCRVPINLIVLVLRHD